MVDQGDISSSSFYFFHLNIAFHLIMCVYVCLEAFQVKGGLLWEHWEVIVSIVRFGWSIKLEGGLMRHEAILRRSHASSIIENVITDVHKGLITTFYWDYLLRLSLYNLLRKTLLSVAKPFSFEIYISNEKRYFREKREKTLIRSTSCWPNRWISSFHFIDQEFKKSRQSDIWRCFIHLSKIVSSLKSTSWLLNQ